MNKRITIVILTATLATLIITPVQASMKMSGPVWADGLIFTMSMSAGQKTSLPANGMAHTDLFLIAPFSSSTPQSTAFPDLKVPASDIVVPAPRQNHGSYGAVWHVTFVYRHGTTEIVNQIGDTPLKSDTAILNAAAASLVDLIETSAPAIVFACPVHAA